MENTKLKETIENQSIVLAELIEEHEKIENDLSLERNYLGVINPRPTNRT